MAPPQSQTATATSTTPSRLLRASCSRALLRLRESRTLESRLLCAATRAARQIRKPRLPITPFHPWRRHAGSNPNLDIKHISIAGTIGNLTLRAYEEDCEFADPAGSLRGLRRFKRNCTNFGSLLEKSNMKLTKWEDLEDKSIGHWRPIMSGDWSLVEVSQNQGLIPAGPSMLLLSLVRRLFLCVFCSGPDTVFTVVPLFQQSGTRNTTSVLNGGRHVENWNVRKMALLRQIFRPSRWVWEKR
ncbi:Nuclear transport factor 2 (NTF2) family protein [Zea mays]|uniref:Nuclear transport factor 2 (NTF2) family protein n=1 Tax=Zea mays TaxID=4577 RepID=A0A1D6HFV3_MAIZE|nr:Nuclear transport factor 2 (NTF2) family protein [Zea mays]